MNERQFSVQMRVCKSEEVAQTEGRPRRSEDNGDGVSWQISAQETATESNGYTDTVVSRREHGVNGGGFRPFRGPEKYRNG